MSFFRELAEYKDFDFWQFWEQVKISEVKTVLSKKKLMKNDYLILLAPIAETVLEELAQEQMHSPHSILVRPYNFLHHYI